MVPQLDAKITLNGTGQNNYFVLDSCGPDCEVLSQFKHRPKVCRKEVFCSQSNVCQYFCTKVVRPRQPVTPISSLSERGDWAPCNGDGNPFCNQGPADCRDTLDYSVCASLANAGQCALMNSLSWFGDIFVPCAATCGSCKHSQVDIFQDLFFKGISPIQAVVIQTTRSVGWCRLPSCPPASCGGISAGGPASPAGSPLPSGASWDSSFITYENKKT